jgi:hypothetical protein
MIKGLNSEESLRDINEYMRKIFVNRARLEKVSESDFDEFYTAYMKKYAEIMHRDDFYTPRYTEVQEMISIAWRELSRGGKDISGVQCAINLALKYFPDNKDALKLNAKIESQGR